MLDQTTQTPGVNGKQTPKIAAQSLLHMMPGGSRSGEVFIKPAADLMDALKATVFKTPEQAIDAVLLASKCEKYKFKRGIEDLKRLCTALCSVDGRSTSFALMGETQVIAPEVLGGLSGSSKKGKRRDLRSAKQNNDDT